MKQKLPFAVLTLVTMMCCSSLRAQFPQPNGGNIRQGTLPDTWTSGGPKCAEVPPWQVHEYNSDFFILRQSGCTDYEKPFLYLVFGKERALLLDTGSRNGDLLPTLEHVVHSWLLRNHRDRIALVVVHSHSHDDHTAGDAQVRAWHDPEVPVTFVPATVPDTKELYGIRDWPEQTGAIDLGQRVIDVIPIPGHDAVSVALYDRQTAILLTGDSVYPGRLYIHDLDDFTRSNQRLISFTEGKPVAQVLGCHIEESTTPFKDYPVGTMYQPDEHELALSRGTLLEIQDALEQLHGVPRRVAYRDFSLWPVGASFDMSPATKAVFDKTQREQQENMWDQNGTETH